MNKLNYTIDIHKLNNTVSVTNKVYAPLKNNKEIMAYLIKGRNNKKTMNKTEALNRIKELQDFIEGLGKEKTYKEILFDYRRVTRHQDCGAWNISKQANNLKALFIISRHLQGDWDREINETGHIIYTDCDGELSCYEHITIKYPTTIYFKDRETAEKALILYKQYLETQV